MDESDQVGVKGLARKLPQLVGHFLWNAATAADGAAAIDGIADERMADMGHVDADLMRAPGFQSAVNQTDHRPASGTEGRFHPVVG